MSAKPQTIDEYLENVEPSKRAVLERIRGIVKGICPDAEESISYQMPTLKYKGRALVYFTASKKHMSFMPSSWAIAEFAEELKDFDTSEHTIRFTLDNLLPDSLIKALVRNHIRDIDADRKSESKPAS